MGEYSGPLYSTSRSDNFSTNPFEGSQQFANAVRVEVEEQFDWVKDNILGSTALDAVQLTSEAIAALRDFELDLPDDITLLEPTFDPILDLTWDIPEVVQENFGSVSPWNPTNVPDLGTLPTISSVTIPKFSSSIGHLSIPEAPPNINIPDPGDGPTAPVLTFPDAPVYTLPDRPTLVGINIPDTPVVNIPTLNLAEFPTFPEMDIDTMIQWTEPTYTPEIWDDVKAQLQTYFAGGTGIRPDVEEAIYARGAEREDREVRRAVMQAEEEWANRGYTAPPGMLSKRIDSLREEGQLKKLGLNREQVIKAMDVEIENLRFAVQQGIVGERMFVDIFLAAAERLFLVQRLHVELQIQYYNSLISAFNAKLQENAIRAQVYEVQVRAALAEIEVFKALIEAESLKVDMNKALIEAYEAEINSRRAIVELYSAEVDTLKVKADVFGSQVDAYRAEIQAYGERVNADKTRFDAYATRMQGEVSKASIIEAEARAYQATVGGIEAGVRAESAALDGAVNAFRAEVEAYRSELAGRTAQNQAELAQIQAHVEAYQAGTQRFIANLNAEEAESRVELAAWETKNNITIAQYEAQVKRFQALLEKAVQQANMSLEGIRSAGQLASTISAGALAAMHVGATISGSGGVSASGTDGVSFSYGDSTSRSCGESRSVNISFEADAEPNINCDI